MVNKLLIKICGKEYVIMGKEPDEYIQKVSLYINKKMSEVMRNNSKLSTAQAAVLTSINVADDYFKTLEAYNTVVAEYSDLNRKHGLLQGERDELFRIAEKNKDKQKELEIKIACLETELRSKSSLQ